MSVGPNDPTRGVLNLPRALQSFHLDRRPPDPGLAPWVENYWEVVWDLPAGTVHRQTNLSHAAVNWAIEDEAWLYGVPGPTFVRELAGSGRVFGVKFHPGASFPWVGKALNLLFDRRVPLAELGLPGLGPWVEALGAEPDFGARSALADRFLLDRRPDLPGEGRRCARRLAEDRTLVQVDQACRVLGYDARSLQRLFQREVGVGPKEVLRRYRLMEAADRLAREPNLGLAALAGSLGYADQAHFSRDFKAVTGSSPEAYRRGLADQQGGHDPR